MTGYLFLAPYALSFSMFLVLPILVALVLSVMQFDLTSTEQIRFVGTQNFIDAWKDDYVKQAMVATARYVLLFVPSLLVLALAMAMGLNALKRGRNLFRGMIFLPGIFTIAVTAILWQFFYNLEFGFFNWVIKQLGGTAVPWLSEKSLAMPSIVLMSLWWLSGGTTVILLASLQQIPTMYHEAAALDGAGGWQTFSKITMPLIKPVLLFTVLTNTIGAFQMFPQASLLTQGGPELSTRGTVQYIYEIAFQQYRLGYAAAISWMLTAVIMVFGVIQFVAMRRNASQ
ncbi:MAG: sugar ABC transporter permease [Armatimonadota bacterium]